MDGGTMTAGAPAMHRWPTRSPSPLMQEEARTPWEMLIACSLLNRTHRRQARAALPAVLSRWSAPERLARADVRQVEEVIRGCGFQRARANRLIRMSEEYAMGAWSNPVSMYGVGQYALDSWALFVEGRLDVSPEDEELRLWMTWVRKERWWWFERRSRA